MWIDLEGVTHTVALPDPTSAMDASFRQSMDHLSDDERARLASSLEELEVQLLEGPADVAQPDEASFEWASLPDGYLTGSFDSVDAIYAYVAQIELRWRLVVVQAMFDLLDRM